MLNLISLSVIVCVCVCVDVGECVYSNVLVRMWIFVSTTSPKGGLRGGQQGSKRRQTVVAIK